MRYKKDDFRLFTRKTKTGYTVWYYYTYDKTGKRIYRSTGYGYKKARDKHSSRRQAEDYCKSLLQKNQLKSDTKNYTLRQWVDQVNFWDWYQSDYIRGRQARSDPDRPGISKNYVTTAAQITRDHVLPYHGHKRIDRITPSDCEDLMFAWIAAGKKHKTANNIRSVYSVILGEAYRLGIIDKNPWERVPELRIKRNPRGGLTIAEVAKILAPTGIDFRQERNRLYYHATKLAFLTGLRIGEVCGLYTDDVKDTYIIVENEKIRGTYLEISKQWNQKTGERSQVKDKDTRQIPIMASLREELEPFLTGSNRFLFSFSPDQSTPISQNHLREWFYRRLEQVGITDRAERNVTFHSTRRFFNTLLRNSGVNDEKIRKFTGHDSVEMTNHYTDYLPEDLRDIEQAQRKFLEKK